MMWFFRVGVFGGVVIGCRFIMLVCEVSIVVIGVDFIDVMFSYSFFVLCLVECVMYLLINVGVWWIGVEKISIFVCVIRILGLFDWGLVGLCFSIFRFICCWRNCCS